MVGKRKCFSNKMGPAIRKNVWVSRRLDSEHSLEVAMVMLL